MAGKVAKAASERALIVVIGHGQSARNSDGRRYSRAAKRSWPAPMALSEMRIQAGMGTSSGPGVPGS